MLTQYGVEQQIDRKSHRYINTYLLTYIYRDEVRRKLKDFKI